MIINQVDNVFNYDLEVYAGPDRAKIYYAFLHNYSSENTRQSYLRDLKQFMSFLTLRFKKMNEFQVERAHVVAYKDFLMKVAGPRIDRYSHRSINRNLACLWSFYEYLLEEKLVTVNPVDRIRRFKIDKENKTCDLTDEQADQLLDVIDTHGGSGKLHKAILTLLFNTGMRHAELSGLKFKNLDFENEFTVIKYKAKGDKMMVTPLNNKTLNALSDYLQWCAGQNLEMGPEHFIFRPTRNPKDGNLDKQLDSKAMNYIIKKYARMIGIMGDITIHSARATVIGRLLDQGHSIDKVADFVGHRDLSTTKAYNKRQRKIGDSLSFSLE